jgi:hypothetical protein
VATSSISFEDAIKEGLLRANKTLRNLRRIDVVSQGLRLDNGKVAEYEATLDITFILE